MPRKLRADNCFSCTTTNKKDTFLKWKVVNKTRFQIGYKQILYTLWFKPVNKELEGLATTWCVNGQKKLHKHVLRPLR